MKLEIATRQRKEKVERQQLKKRTSCPKCKSTSLLTEGPDQFCCDCDWDTCFEYVEKGLMNNLEVAAWEHFADLPVKNEIAPVEITAEAKASLVASA